MKFKCNPYDQNVRAHSKWLKDLPYELIPFELITWTDRDSLISLFRALKRDVKQEFGYNLDDLKMIIRPASKSYLGTYKDNIVTIYGNAAIYTLVHEMVHHILKEERQHGVMHSSEFFRVLNNIGTILIQYPEIEKLYLDIFNKQKYEDMPNEVELGDLVSINIEEFTGDNIIEGFIIEKYKKSGVWLYSARLPSNRYYYNLQLGKHFIPAHL